MRKAIIFIFVTFLLVFCAAPVYADDILPLPHAFCGTVDINGNPAPENTTTVEARGKGVITGEDNPITVTEEGKFGSPEALGQKLIVKGDIANGTKISFLVNGTYTDTTFDFKEGETTVLELNLVITTTTITGEVEEIIPSNQTDYPVDASDIADTTITVSTTGVVTITVQKYADNPGDGAPSGFSSTGKYIDVHLDNPANVDEIEIRNYYTLEDIAGLNEATLKLSWWDVTAEPPAWIECTNSGVEYPLEGSDYRGYVWAIIGTDTTPTLDDLAGTPFMSMAAPAPAGGGGGGGPPTLPAGTTDVRGMISLAGVFYTSATANSEDELCRLTIPAGTVGLTEELEPLTIITMLIMDDPPLPPEAAHVIGLFYDFQPSGATFEPPITLKYSYDPDNIPEGIAEEDLVLAYYDQKVGEWVNLEGTVDTGRNTITALLSHFTAFAILGYEVVPEPPAFTPSSLVISPTEVDIDQTVNVSLSVANTGGMAGSYKVTLKIDGEVEATQQVTVGAGASETVTFTVSRDVAGSYSIDVNGLSGSFTVKEEVAPAPPAPPPPAPPEVKPINWPVVGGIIAAVVIVGLLIFFVARRRAY